MISGAIDLASGYFRRSFCRPAGAQLRWARLAGDLDLYYEDVYSGCRWRSGSSTPGGPKQRRWPHTTDSAGETATAAAFDVGHRAQGGWSTRAGSAGRVRGGRTARFRPCRSHRPEQGGMQRDYWYLKRAHAGAGSIRPRALELEAARRTLRRLNARRVTTQKCARSCLRAGDCTIL